MTTSNTTQGAKRITPFQVVAALLTLPLHRQLEVAENLEVRGGLSTDLHNVDLCKEILRRVVAADKLQQLKEYLALVSSPDQPTAPASPSPVTETKGEGELAIDNILLPLQFFDGVDEGVLKYARSKPLNERVADIAEWMRAQKQVIRDYVALKETNQYQRERIDELEAASPTPSPSAPDRSMTNDEKKVTDEFVFGKFADAAAQQDKGWAERAAREIRKLADKEAGNGMMPDRSDMATIIAKAFAGFVPREEVEVAKKSTQFFADKCSAASIERENMSRQLVAAQAQNAHLLADNAVLQEKLSSYENRLS